MTDPRSLPVSPGRLDAVADLFAEALERDAPGREALIASVHSRDPDLAGALGALVNAHFADPAFLAEPIGQELAGVMTAQHEAALVGKRIGGWHVESVLHRGGMGTVYRAQRVEVDFEQHAALKVIRLGLDTQALVERFAQERRLLARLEHPHIARLLDGGTTADGMPYLVMEHVDGETIDAWCARQRPSLERLLAVFTQVCAAVNFAHQRLVVHQDIKPANILVTPDGTAKLLDFGIAELERGATPELRATASRAGGLMLTPDYASPEQFRGEAVGTATDIYSLGVLLYRLVTGASPYRIPAGLGVEEAERLVRDTIPPAPSAVLTDRGQRVPPRVADLDAIILKALHKAPADRYASALTFAEDLRRFTAELPVEARPATVGYRVSRFVGRNWAGVAAATTIVALLVAGISVTRWQAGVAAEQRDVARAEAATAASAVEFLKTVLGSGDPWRDTETATSVEDVIRLAEAQLDSLLGDEPAARAYILAALGAVATGRSDLERADRLTAAAVTILATATEIGPAQASEILLARSLALHEHGRLDDARGITVEAVKRLEHADPGAWQALAGALNQLGALDIDLGNVADAEPTLRRAAALYTANADTTHLGLAAVYNNLAVALASQPDRLEEVAAMYGRAAGIVERTGASAPRLATLLMNQSGTLRLLGRTEDAEATALRAIGLFTESLGADHPSTLTAVGSLGVLYEAIGAFGQSVETVRPAIALALAALPADHPTVAYLQNVYGAAVCQMPDEALIPEGLRAAQASLETRLAAFGPEHWAVASGEAIVGHCLARSGRRDAGIAMLEQAITQLRTQRGEDHDLTIRAQMWLGELQ